ncbi:hypothetical protein EfmJHP9_28040 [Enterococcus faecium]|nr:hypothetical protein EfmJHP9_28040 [Enterococcus faecium]
MKEAVLEIFYLAPKIQRIRAMKETSIQEGSDSPLKSFDIELRDVSFSYDNNTPILDHISFLSYCRFKSRKSYLKRYLCLIGLIKVNSYFSEPKLHILLNDLIISMYR